MSSYEQSRTRCDNQTLMNTSVECADVEFETRSLPTLTRSYPHRFTFYVADPISSIRSERLLRPFTRTHDRELQARLALEANRYAARCSGIISGL